MGDYQFETMYAEKGEGIASLFILAYNSDNEYLSELAFEELDKLGDKENNENICDVAINRMTVELIDTILDDCEDISDEYYINISGSLLIVIHNLEELGKKYAKDYKVGQQFYETAEALYANSEPPMSFEDEVYTMMDEESEVSAEEIYESNKALVAISELGEQLSNTIDTTDINNYNEQVIKFSLIVHYLTTKYSILNKVAQPIFTE